MIRPLREWFIRTRQTSHHQRLKTADLERITEMSTALAKGELLTRPSRYWEELNKMNLAQLSEHGYENFKRTIALNYFTWVRILPWDSQIVFLCKNVSMAAIFRAIRRAFVIATRRYFSTVDVIQSFSYGLLGSLLWEYILGLKLPAGQLELQEPMEGNPPLLYPRPHMRVSQDLANSLLEYESVQALISKPQATILELGGGYGRNAFVILKLHPGIRYVLVDIPPALWIAERYLSSIFSERRIFRYRDFDKFADIADEFAQADIAFLLSSQLPLLPRDSADLVINISSLHEMRKDQVAYYMSRFDHVLKIGGHLYLKQWKEAKVLFEGVTLVAADYPIPPEWAQIMNRTARVQTRFFEAVYQKKGDSTARNEDRLRSE
jgi:putative sugar O-methyltransferase